MSECCKPPFKVDVPTPIGKSLSDMDSDEWFKEPYDKFLNAQPTPRYRGNRTDQDIKTPGSK